MYMYIYIYIYIYATHNRNLWVMRVDELVG